MQNKNSNALDLWGYLKTGELQRFKSALEKCMAIDAGIDDKDKRLINEKRCGETLVHRACKDGKPLFLKSLIRAGADLAAAEDATGDTPLITLAKKEHSPITQECLELLMAKYDDLRPNAANNAGLTALDAAINQRPDGANAELLRKQGAWTGRKFKIMHCIFPVALAAAYFLGSAYVANLFPYETLDPRTFESFLPAVTIGFCAILLFMFSAQYFYRGEFDSYLKKRTETSEFKFTRLMLLLGFPALVFYARIDAIDLVNQTFPVDASALPLTVNYMTWAVTLLRIATLYLPICLAALYVTIFIDKLVPKGWNDKRSIITPSPRLIDLSILIFFLLWIVLGSLFADSTLKANAASEFELGNSRDTELASKIRRFAFGSDFSNNNLCDNPELEMNDHTDKAVGVLFYSGFQGKVLGLAKSPADQSKLAFKLADCMKKNSPAPANQSAATAPAATQNSPLHAAKHRRKTSHFQQKPCLCQQEPNRGDR